MTLYQAVSGSGLSDDQAERVGQAIEEIRERCGGRFTVEDVLNEARKKSSPLHEFYVWDTDAAAEKYWIERTRYLIRSVKITVERRTRNGPKEVEVRAFEKMYDGETRLGEFASVKDMVDTGDKAGLRTVVSRIHRDIKRLMKRAEAYDELAKARGAMKAVLTELVGV